jgi:peptidyl-dipeptidase Dcp
MRSFNKPSSFLPLLALVSTAAQAALAAPPAAGSGNPLLIESALPYHLPPFDKIRDEHFTPAYELGMAEELKEVEAIANSSAKPTFDNTIVALERAGQLLARVGRVFSNLNGTNTNPAMQKIESAMSPKLAAQRDAIRLNPALFARIADLHGRRATLGLDPESDRLLDRYYKDFVRAGAKLADTDKAKLKAINAELATLQTNFTQNVLKDTNASAVVVEKRAELAGLTDGQIAAAAAAAKADGKEGKFLLHLQNTSGQPLLASLENRALRERLHRASLARNSHGGAHDNLALIPRIARLRAERAALLGFPNYAAYSLEEQTARTVGAVNKLLAELAAPAVANARREAAAMQAEIDRAGGGFQLAPWDWSFYAEKVRRARYAFDAAELKPYFEINRVLRDGVFYAAGRLFGLTFKERKDLPLYHPDVQVYEVFDADGKPFALFLTDFYARPSKRGGAWANAYVSQSGLLNRRPVIANHLNVPKPAAGEPTLLTSDEVNTMFHEFGHALHGLLSDVKYPRFAGTSVPRDFVEFPSQVNEIWADWPEVLKNYAKHHRTGEPIPAALLEKMQAAEKFNQGFATTEYLAAALLDQAWHQLAPADVPGDAVAFEVAALKKAGVDFAPVPPRYRSGYFSHTFSGGYAAGYYSYIWAEVLDADAGEWFRQNGGLTRANGDRLRRTVLSRGGSQEAMDMFRAFRGGDPTIAALLKRRGLDQASAAPAR